MVALRAAGRRARLLFGLALGWIASLLMPRAAPLRARAMPAHQKSLFALGVAFATYGVTVSRREGNGFIAVFVARSCSASAAPTCARTSSAAPRS